MEDNIKKFCENYTAMKEWVEPEERDIYNPFGNRRPTFVIEKVSLGGYKERLLLDDEDLDILYEKYSAKLIEEMEANIKKIKEEYGNAIKEG